MKPRDLNMIRIKPYGVKPKTFIKHNYPVVGLDTETYEGKVTLIADSIGKYLVSEDLTDILGFLTRKELRESSNFFFNLTYDANAIIKHLPIRHQKILAYDGTVNYVSVNDSCSYRLDLIPNKCLKIKSFSYANNEDNDSKYHKINTVKFFDISQFYQYGSLEDTYNKVFKQQNKTYKKRIQATDKGFPIEDINDNVIEYCKEDAIACYELAKNFTDMASDYVNLKDYYSPASISKAFIKQNLDDVYRFKSNTLQDSFLKSYSGGRFEVIKRGSFGLRGEKIGDLKCEDSGERAFMYDINSAYPSIIHTLQDTNGIIETNKRIEDNTAYSVYKINVKIDDCIISPMKSYIMGGRLLAYPMGDFIEIYVIKEELDMLLNYGHKVEILNAYHIKENEGVYPFAWIKDLYELRKKFKEPKHYDRRELILKLACNAVYGCTIQMTGKLEKPESEPSLEELNTEDYKEFISCSECAWTDYGEIRNLKLCPKCNSLLNVEFKKRIYSAGQYFNPAFASTITGNIRCKMFKDSVGKNRQYENNVIMFATDSITFDKKVNHLKISKELGEYSKDENLRGIVLGSGLYTFFKENAESIEIKNKFRGFGKSNLYDIVRNNRNENEFIFKKKSPVKLKESKNRPEDLNIFMEKEKKLRPDFDIKRNWLKPVKKFDDLLKGSLDSRPLRI